MADRLVVDRAALLEGASQVHAFATQVREASGTLVAALLAAEPVLAGAVSGPALAALTDASSAAHGDLAVAVDGLAAGLETTAATVTSVDVQLAR